MEVLNSFFSSVFTEENLNSIPDIPDYYIGNNPIKTVLFTEEKVKEKIMNWSARSAPGPDEITPRLLQAVVNEISEPLALLFEKSMQEGKVPEEWKTANVSPIYKKGTKANPTNYRPISLTCIACRIMESIIKDEIVAHLRENNLDLRENFERRNVQLQRLLTRDLIINTSLC